MIKKHQHKILAKGVDSLYLYLETSAINLPELIEKLSEIDYDQSILYRGLPLTKVKAWIRTFPHCVRHGQFMFFLNAKAMFIKVLSLAFEMRGYDFSLTWLCNTLDHLAVRKTQVAWMDLLKVSRIDIYTDFAFDEDFEMKQFRTTLRKHGYFQSGKEAEGKTLYFGSRSYFMVRLYVKSAEIKHSGKDYLVSSWNSAGRVDDGRVWRLEFEFHKDRIRSICDWNQLTALDDGALESMWAFGIEAIEYCDRPAKNRNLSKMPLHPVWRDLQTYHRAEYHVSPAQVHTANVEYRLKRARTWVISWFAARGVIYDDIPEEYRRDFEISRVDLEKAVSKLPMNSDDDMAGF